MKLVLQADEGQIVDELRAAFLGTAVCDKKLSSDRQS